MPTGFTYDTYQEAVVTQIPSLLTDPNFQTMLPAAIDYAEMTICRDLDFLAMHGDIALGSATIGVPTVSVPSGVIVVEALSYGASGAQVPPASRDFIKAVFAGAANGPPQYFAVVGGASGDGWTPAMSVLLGPAPDQTYVLSAYGTQRQATLSATNTTTFISTQLPDLFWAASMIFWAGYNRNFGAAGVVDDAGQAVTWRVEYQRLMKGAEVEEARKKFQSQSWGPQMPSPIATPPRT